MRGGTEICLGPQANIPGPCVPGEHEKNMV